MKAEEARELAIKSCGKEIYEIFLEIKVESHNGGSFIQKDNLKGGTVIMLKENGYDLQLMEIYAVTYIIKRYLISW